MMNMEFWYAEAESQTEGSQMQSIAKYGGFNHPKYQKVIFLILQERGFFINVNVKWYWYVGFSRWTFKGNLVMLNNFNKNGIETMYYPVQL